MWEKCGKIFSPNAQWNWAQHYAILPTPELINNDVIRVYYSSLDLNNIGRISYVDVAAEHPKTIVEIHPSPVLEAGEPGCFDDCGVNPCSIAYVDRQKYLYYIGYQRTELLPYLAFCGLAKMNADGTFSRMQQTPILERNPKELYLRSSATVVSEPHGYAMWYVSGIDWKEIDGSVFLGRKMPRYGIRKAISKDGIHWIADEDFALIGNKNNDEFGIARPWVLKEGNIYKMWFSVRRASMTYRLGYAESEDGIVWERNDEKINIRLSESGWDSEMICYPAILEYKDRRYLFYNGNNNGKSGFGYAVESL